jgi:phosphotransferase system  glucose/maltose/N-acetylglucosamine-specific IIC component
MNTGVQSIGLAMIFDEPKSYRQEAMAIAVFALRC